MMVLDHYTWHSSISLQTKVRLYNTYILQILLYGADTWSMMKESSRRINAWHVVPTPYFAYSIYSPYHQQGSKAQDQSGSSHLSHCVEASPSFRSHHKIISAFSATLEQLSTVSRRTGSAQEVDLGVPGSVPLNSTSNCTTWASTRRGSRHRTAQNDVNL